MQNKFKKTIQSMVKIMIDVRTLSTSEIQERLAWAQAQLASLKNSPAPSGSRLSPSELQSNTSKVEELVKRVSMAEHCLSSMIEKGEEKDRRINDLESRINSQNEKLENLESRQSGILTWSRDLFQTLGNKVSKMEEVRSPMHLSKENVSSKKLSKNKSLV